jgi:hypothetical protein
MTKPAVWSIVAAVAFCAIVVGAYNAGASRASARSAFVQTVPLREEHKCVVSGEVECFRVNWHLRAAIVAEQSRRGLESSFPSGVEAQLQEFNAWQSQVPVYRLPQK